MVETLHPSTHGWSAMSRTMQTRLQGLGVSPGLHAVLAHEGTSATILVKMNPDSAPCLP